MIKTNTVFELEILKNQASLRFIRHQSFMRHADDYRLVSSVIANLDLFLEGDLDNALQLFFYYWDSF